MKRRQKLSNNGDAYQFCISCNRAFLKLMLVQHRELNFHNDYKSSIHGFIAIYKTPFVCNLKRLINCINRKKVSFIRTFIKSFLSNKFVPTPLPWSGNVEFLESPIIIFSDVKMMSFGMKIYSLMFCISN